MCKEALYLNSTACIPSCEKFCIIIECIITFESFYCNSSDKSSSAEKKKKTRLPHWTYNILGICLCALCFLI